MDLGLDLARTLMLGLDTSWLLDFVWTSLSLDSVVNGLCIWLLWKELTSRLELETSKGTYSINASTAQHLSSSCFFVITSHLLHTLSPSHFLPLLASHLLAFFLPRRHCSFLILAQSSHYPRCFALVTMLSPFAVLPCIAIFAPLSQSSRCCRCWSRRAILVPFSCICTASPFYCLLILARL
jgi:hypothetical protein